MYYANFPKTFRGKKQLSIVCMQNTVQYKTVHIWFLGFY